MGCILASFCEFPTMIPPYWMTLAYNDVILPSLSGDIMKRVHAPISQAKNSSQC